MVFDEHYMDTVDMESKDRKTAKSIFPACIYLLHTELNGDILCNLYILYKVSVHTVFQQSVLTSLGGRRYGGVSGHCNR